ncbi:MAG: hypothetical protein FWC13_12580 [Oscillospiraceae bacterium]|nr:hypothetical protein [Oscillospiraceae bacterium]
MELNYLNDILVELEEDDQLKLDGGGFWAFAALMLNPPPESGTLGC